MELKSSEEAAAQAFNLQYTSLILILLTFVAGVFVGPRIGAPVEAALSVPRELAAPAPPPAIPSIAEVLYEDLFLSGETLNPAGAEAIAHFLKSHDVNAQFEIAAGPDEQALETALRRGGKLLEYLNKRGVPPRAAETWVLPDRTAHKIVRAVFAPEQRRAGGLQEEP